MRVRVPLVVVLFLCTAPSGTAQTPPQHEHAGTPPERLGTVHFETSCAAEVRGSFDRAVALLHSFWFHAAVEAFTDVTTKDAGCGIAYWGIALSHWGNPFAGFRSPQALAAGRDASAKGLAASRLSPRERGYVTAVAELFRDYETSDQRTRALAYAKQMEAVTRDNPEDTEAAMFYALALTQTALPSDKTYKNQLAAGAILEPLFKAQPDHPGLAHYLIHSYDVPALAPRALDAATRYAKIAPSAPHALHMPSHTFTRVGYWQESIDTNRASAEAARRDKAVAEELHAFDYQVYAYLQTGQDRAAREVVDKVPALESRIAAAPVNAAPPVAGYYALAAIPARYALERGAWDEAAALTPLATPFVYPDSLRHFARALGAARAGRPAAAVEDLSRLIALREALIQKKDAYWAEQVDIQRRTAEAWIAFADGKVDEALATMRAAADLEDTTEKSSISPGPLTPAREQLGDMLLASRRPIEALAAYEASIAKEPNRFRGLDGARRAAAAAKQPDAAARYRQRLLEICKMADTPGRPELTEVRATKE
jgi:hypothetical protein